MNLSEMIRYLCVLATPLLSRLTYIFVGNIPLDLNRVLVISKFKKDLNICYISIHERMVCTAITELYVGLIELLHLQDLIIIRMT